MEKYRILVRISQAMARRAPLFCSAPIADTAKKDLRILAALENHNSLLCPVSVEQLGDCREALLAEAFDLPLEPRIKLSVRPRHIDARCSKTGNRSLKTYLCGKVEENDRIRIGNAPLHRATVIAVDDIAVPSENFSKPFVKLLARNMRSVGLMPYGIEVKERNAQPLVKS